MNTSNVLFPLIALAATLSVSAQTAANPAGRSLRTPENPAKAGPERQAFVVPDVDHVFPYFLSSASWTTTFYLTNLEDRDITVNCEFVGTGGEEKPLKFSFTKEGEDPTAFTTSVISKFSTQSFSTVSTATTLTTAWAFCSADPRTDRFSGYAVVRNTAANGAARDFFTTLQPDSEPIFSVPYLDSATNTTGLILVNTSIDTDSSLAYWVYDAQGRNTAADSIILKPGNLRVIVLNEAFKDTKSGTVRVVNVEGSKLVTGLALRTSAAGYSAFPPLTPKEAPPAPAPAPAPANPEE